MPYQHRNTSDPHLNLPVGKAVCVGRNYADHARELNNPVPTTPLLFIKPATAMTELESPLRIPEDRGPCHFEAELAVLIGQPLTNADEAEARRAVAGYGLGLDLTLRQLQDQLKQQGHPWEIAKAFDHSCPLSTFVPAARIDNVEDTEYRLWLNGELRQHGRTNRMITPVSQLLAYCSRHFTLLPGDVVLTGTPAGVGELKPGDQLRLQLAEALELHTEVIGRSRS